MLAAGRSTADIAGLFRVHRATISPPSRHTRAKNDAKKVVYVQ
jgi:hypothetical protein